MAKLGGIPGVVGVKSVFIQNETAYIVMDFIEGETLLKKLQKNGPMDFDSCVKLMTPIMQALAEVHEHGIIHRDISPDNIMVRPDGKLILLDLGAAKDLDIQGNDGSVQSSQMVAKHGFSPVEQYGQAGKIGSWTDVYAMAATIYYCCTGVLPPSATDRMIEDTLTCRPRLTKEQFDVLAAGMSILPQKRPQDMAALLQMVTRLQKGGKAEPVRPAPQAEPAKAQQTTPVPPRPADVKPPVKNAPPKTPQKKPLPAWLIPAVAGIVAVLGIVVCIVTATGKAPRQNVSMQSGRAEPVLRARACGNHAQGNHAQSNRAQGHGTQARTHYEAYTAQELYRICGWLLGKHKSERRELQSECPRAGFLHPAGTMQGNDRQHGSIHERGNKVQRMAGVGKSERAVPENRQDLPARR